MNDTTDKQEFKFIARIYSVRRTILLAYGMMLLVGSSFIFTLITDGKNSFALSLLVVSLLSSLSFGVLISRRIRIIIEHDIISIFYGKKLKHKAAISELKEIRGVDIDKKYARSELRILFDSKVFYFYVWEFPYTTPYRQAMIIKYFTERYKFEKKLNKKTFPFILDTYRYINPTYKSAE
ncbi:hypothetical protein [Dysgonomonas massiliensis]|uniref:hypothetical protein n=1 Tax=Dysgonomonas massiliensis TaxID=2040292 RepID=UPI000C766891|nr:hypothetical protein [Dysgonomonas massiliensis]